MQALRCIFLGVLWTVGRPGNDGNPLLYSINLMHNCIMNDDDISACLSLLVLIPNIPTMILYAKESDSRSLTRMEP